MFRKILFLLLCFSVFRLNAQVDPLFYTTLSPYEAEPADFQTFWDDRKNELNVAPYNTYGDVTTTQVLDNAQVRVWSFSMKTISIAHYGSTERRIYGYIAVPKTGGPFPVVMMCPPWGYGADILVVSDGWLNGTADLAVKSTCIAVSIGVHNNPLNQASSETNYTKIGVSTQTGTKDRFNNYYKPTILGALRVFKYLFTNPSIGGTPIGVDTSNPRAGITGNSQGGGLPIIIAALDSRVKVLAISKPGFGDVLTPYYGGPTNYFPWWWTGDPALDNPAKPEIKYYEAAYFAKRFTGFVQVDIGYLDNVVGKRNMFVIMNQFRNAKNITVHEPNVGHGHENDFWYGRYDNFFRHLRSQTNPVSDSWNLDFTANAGADFTQTSTSTALTGSVLSGASNYTSFTDPKWELIEKPAGATLTVNSSVNPTSVNFSGNPNGEYLFRFTATVFNNGTKIYTVSDYVKVTLNLTAGPDYIIQSPGTLPATPIVAPNTAFTLSSVVLKNNGSATSTASVLKYYASADQTLNVGVDVLLATSPNISGLAAGASQTISPNPSLSIATPGKYYIIVVADANNSIAESSETNNNGVTSNQITVGPDLRVLSVGTPSATTVAAGANITMTNAQVKNEGSAAGASTLKYYWSSNQSFEAGTDVQIGSNVAVPALGVNITHTYTTTVTVPSGAANGTYYILAHADAPTGVITEADETNNVLASTAITVGSGSSCTNYTDCTNGSNNATIQGCVQSVKAIMLTSNIQYMKIWNSTYSTSWWLCSPWGGDGQPACTNGTTPTRAGLSAGTYHVEVSYTSGANCFRNNVVVTNSFAPESDDRAPEQTQRWDGSGVQLFPNPAEDVLNITLDLPEGVNLRVQLMNSLGQVLPNFDQLSGGFKAMQLNCASLEKGIYFLSLQYGDKRTVKSFVKQ